MAKDRIHDMPVTRGRFEVKGLTNGIEKENFYTEKKTRTGKDFRMINFGVEYDDHTTIYMTLNGMPRDVVYFSKKGDDGKNVTKQVPWNNRNDGATDGYRMIGGVNVGLTKTTDKNGKSVNDKKLLTDFDACSYIEDNMEDEMSVYVRGQLDFSSYINNNGEVSRSTKFVPNQISLCKEVDFEEDGYNPSHDFTQTIVFMGIEQEKIDDKPTGRFVVEAKIVNYNSVESATFFVEDSKFASQLRKGLKPYWAIEVHGKINVVNNIETVVEEDCWGEANAMERVGGSTRRELVITGAKPSTIDKETYTEKAIAEALRKMHAAATAEVNFTGKVESSTTDWGDTFNDDDDDDELGWE